MGLGTCCADFVLVVPFAEYLPLLLLKGEFRRLHRPDKERPEVFVFLLVPLRHEAVRLADHVGNASAGAVIPLVLDEDVFGRSVIEHMVAELFNVRVNRSSGVWRRLGHNEMEAQTTACPTASG